MTCSATALIATGMRNSSGTVTSRHCVIAGQAAWEVSQPPRATGPNDVYRKALRAL
jgi:hypothetical protein